MNMITNILKFVALILITLCIIACQTYTTQIDEVTYYDLTGKAMKIRKLPLKLTNYQLDTCNVLIINDLDQMTNVASLLKDMYDRLFIIHCIDSHRIDNINRQLDYLGLRDDKFVYIHYSTRNNMAQCLYDCYTNTYPSLDNHYKASTFGCTLDHYNVWQISLKLGYENILVLEDDAHILRDLSRVEDVLADRPANYDVIQFDYTLRDRHIELLRRLNDYLSATYHRLEHNDNCWMSDAYALSRRGMEMCTTILDRYKDYFIADYPHYLLPALGANSYVSGTKLFISDTFNSTRDETQTLAEDVIRLNTPDRSLYVCD